MHKEMQRIWQSLASTVLSHKVGRFLDIPYEKLKVSILKKAIIQENVQFKKDALIQMGIPLEIVSGIVGKIDCHVPWSSLKSESVKLKISDLHLVVRPKEIEEVSEKERKKTEEKSKREMLQKLEAEDPDLLEEDNGFLAKLAETVIRNIMVDISDVHIRYEDSSKSKSPFHNNMVLGFLLKNLSVVTADENFEAKFVDVKEDVIRKLANIVQMSFYCDSDPVVKNGVVPSNFMEEMKERRQRVLDQKAQIGTVNFEAKLRKSGELGVVSTWTGDILVNTKEIQLSRMQYILILELLDSMGKSLKLKRKKVKKSRRIDPVVEVQRKSKYVSLYKRKYERPWMTKLSSAELKEISSLDDTLEFDNVIFYRTLAREEMRAESKRHKDVPKKKKKFSLGRWLSSKAGSEKEKDDISAISLSKQEQEDLYATVGYDDAISSALEGEKVEWNITVDFKATVFSLIDDKESDSIPIFRLGMPSIKVRNLASEKAMQIKVEMGGFRLNRIHDNVKGRPLVSMERPVNANDTNLENLVCVVYESGDENPIPSLEVSLSKMQLYFDRKDLQTLVGFFQPPTALDIGFLANGMEKLSSEAKKQVAKALDDSEKMKMKISLDAPTIIFPVPSSDEQLFMDFGHLQIDTADVDTVAAEDIPKYDAYTCALEGIHVLVQNKGKPKKTSNQEPLYVLQMQNGELSISTLLKPKLYTSLTQTYVRGTLPSLIVDLCPHSTSVCVSAWNEVKRFIECPTGEFLNEKVEESGMYGVSISGKSVPSVQGRTRYCELRGNVFLIHEESQKSDVWDVLYISSHASVENLLEDIPTRIIMHFPTGRSDDEVTVQIDADSEEEALSLHHAFEEICAQSEDAISPNSELDSSSMTSSVISVDLPDPNTVLIDADVVFPNVTYHMRETFDGEMYTASCESCHLISTARVHERDAKITLGKFKLINKKEELIVADSTSRKDHSMVTLKHIGTSSPNYSSSVAKLAINANVGSIDFFCRPKLVARGLFVNDCICSVFRESSTATSVIVAVPVSDKADDNQCKPSDDLNTNVHLEGESCSMYLFDDSSELFVAKCRDLSLTAAATSTWRWSGSMGSVEATKKGGLNFIQSNVHSEHMMSFDYSPLSSDSGSDQHFTHQIVLDAKGISVVYDYPTWNMVIQYFTSGDLMQYILYPELYAGSQSLDAPSTQLPSDMKSGDTPFSRVRVLITLEDNEIRIPRGVDGWLLGVRFNSDVMRIGSKLSFSDDVWKSDYEVVAEAISASALYSLENEERMFSNGQITANMTSLSVDEYASRFIVEVGDIDVEAHAQTFECLATCLRDNFFGQKEEVGLAELQTGEESSKYLVDIRSPRFGVFALRTMGGPIAKVDMQNLNFNSKVCSDSFSWTLSATGVTTDDCRNEAKSQFPNMLSFGGNKESYDEFFDGGSGDSVVVSYRESLEGTSLDAFVKRMDGMVLPEFWAELLKYFSDAFASFKWSENSNVKSEEEKRFHVSAILDTVRLSIPVSPEERSALMASVRGTIILEHDYLDKTGLLTLNKVQFGVGETLKARDVTQIVEPSDVFIKWVQKMKNSNAYFHYLVRWPNLSASLSLIELRFLERIIGQIKESSSRHFSSASSPESQSQSPSASLQHYSAALELEDSKVVIVDDTRGFDVPVFSFHASESSARVRSHGEMFKFKINVRSSLDTYSPHVGAWEPLVECCHMIAKWKRPSEKDKPTSRSLNIDFPSSLEVNLQSTFLEVFNSFMDRWKMSEDIVNGENSMSGSWLHPYNLWNKTGEDLAVNIRDEPGVLLPSGNRIGLGQISGPLKFGNYSVSALSQVGIEILSTGETVSNMSIVQEGTFAHILDATGRSLFCAIAISDMQRQITLSSHISVENKSDKWLNLAVSGCDDTTIFVEAMGPGCTSYVPLNLLDAKGIVVTSNSSEDGVVYSGSFSFKEIEGKTKKLLSLGDEKNPFYLISCCDEPFPRCYKVNLSPFISIVNSLPVDVQFGFLYSSPDMPHVVDTVVPSGEAIAIPPLDPRERMFMTILPTGPYLKSSVAFINNSIHGGQQDRISTDIVVYDVQMREMMIYIDNIFDKNLMTRRIHVYSKMWIVNRCGLYLSLKDESGVHLAGPLPGRRQADEQYKLRPLINTPLLAKKETEIGVAVHDENHRCIDTLKIPDVDLWKSELTCRGVSKEEESLVYHLAVKLERGKGVFSRTKILTVLPRLVIKNTLQCVVEVRQLVDSRNAKLHRIAPDETIALYCIVAAKPLLIQFRILEWSDIPWTSPLPVDKMREFVLPLSSEFWPRVIFDTDVCQTFVTVAPPAVEPPFVVENRTNYAVKFHQDHVNELWTLPPGVSLPFAWTRPDMPMRLKVMYSDAACTLDPDDIGDKIKMKTSDHESICCKLSTSGGSRMIVIESESSDNVEQSSSSSLNAKIEIPKIGISFISRKPSELFYCSLMDTSLSILKTDTDRGMTLVVRDLQVDCQQPDCGYTVFIRSKEKDSLVRRKKNERSFLHISLSQMISDDNIYQIKYFAAAIQRGVIEMDDITLTALSDFMEPLLGERTSPKTHNWDMMHVSDELKENNVPLFVRFLSISQISFDVTFTTNMVSSWESSDRPLLSIMRTAGLAFRDISGLPLSFKAFKIENLKGTSSAVIALKEFYRRQLQKKFILAIGALDIIGNPVSVLHNLGSGFRSFFQEPKNAVVEGPEAFMGGLAQGTYSLLRGATDSVFEAAGRITSSVGKAVTAASMDKDFIRASQEKRKRRPKHAVDGFVKGGKSLFGGIFSGVSGLVEKPVSGAKSGGVGGFFKGVGKGIAGVVTKPVAGAMEFASSTAQGIKNTPSALQGHELRRNRLPRHLVAGAPLSRYDPDLAECVYILSRSKTGRKNPGENVTMGQVLSSNFVLIITDNFVLLGERNSKKQMWSAPLRNILEVKSSGRELMVKEKKVKLGRETWKSREARCSSRHQATFLIDVILEACRHK